jgi:allophanate hydrolase subunit 2
MGARLDGPPLPVATAEPLPSHGVPFGAIQVPPDGRPILLLADHQTTGGYPVVGVVISADLPAAGQLRPGAVVRLREVSFAAARGALLAQRAAWKAAVASLTEAARWDDLWRSAGG